MNESTIADLTSNVSRMRSRQMTTKTEIVSSGYDITIMKWSGWPLTAIIAAISLAISYVLFQFGIYLFFLPIIFFIPFAGFFRLR